MPIITISTIVSIITAYATGQRLANLIIEFSVGQDYAHLNKAFVFFKRYIDSDKSEMNKDLLRNAIREFQYVNKGPNRLHAVANSYYYSAAAHSLLQEYEKANHYLNLLSKIEYNSRITTIAAGRIDDIKIEGKKLQKEIQKLLEIKKVKKKNRCLTSVIMLICLAILSYLLWNKLIV